jgi:hypothetical protein
MKQVCLPQIRLVFLETVVCELNPALLFLSIQQWRTAWVGFWGVQTPPENSEVLTNLSQIPSSVENTSVTT